MESPDQINPYAAPQSRVEEPATPGALYVVSPRKLVLLSVATFGLYSVYWFYAHWDALRRAEKANWWPVMRGIFSIFFAHSLFAKFDELLRARNVRHDWSPQLLALTYVVASVAANVLNRLSGKGIGSPMTDIVGTLMIVPLVWSLYDAQRAANAAEGDPQGTRNASLTGANWFWLVLGGILWLLFALGLYAILAGVPME